MSFEICLNNTYVDNSFLLSLPRELLLNICENLDIEDLLQLKSVSKEFYTLSTDRRVWRTIAEKKGVWIEEGLDPQGELMRIRQITLLSHQAPFVLSVAKLLGAGHTLAILQGEESSAKFYRNQALTIQCVDAVYQQAFTLKVLASKNHEEVDICYARLNPILDRLGKTKVGKHSTFPAKNFVAGYVRSLIQGNSRGILREGGEDLDVQIYQQPSAFGA
ncbi:F-box protein [Estrella lausannensis]|uniref:F-box domain-containing protein n=1 Tax=Estrella lausannensis TaxID=483423 RepID=A0A0H5DSE9_9BACT|nr:F-box protein [Estrella lausannensis]CRX39218.1 F-box domain-containing protein [Estrella lausannensis]